MENFSFQLQIRTELNPLWTSPLNTDYSTEQLIKQLNNIQQKTIKHNREFNFQTSQTFLEMIKTCKTKQEL